jgi:superfamily I DNA and/or RNA helicase
LPSIAVISPYREQVIHIKKELEEDPKLTNVEIAVNTIDGFQGQEKDVVYISLVRSNGKSEIGFLGDTRRMNVAMTRARKQLVIVGDSATIGSHPFYDAFLSYCEQNGLYQTAWEYMQ